MNTLKTLTAAAALALAFAPQTTITASAQSLSYSTIVAQDHSMRGSKLIGMEIFNEKGEKIGKIEDILVKGTASEPMAVLSVPGAKSGETRMVAVPLSHVNLKSDKASMAATKIELAAMPTWQFQGLAGGGG